MSEDGGNVIVRVLWAVRAFECVCVGIERPRGTVGISFEHRLVGEVGLVMLSVAFSKDSQGLQKSINQATSQKEVCERRPEEG